MNIVEFLEARIEEDEAEARNAIEERARVTPGEGADMGLQSWPDVGVPAVLVGPERILSECAAKRAIIALAQKATEVEQEWDDYEWQGTVERTQPWTGDAILFALAAVHKDHQDYLQEWSDAPRET